ncbi:uncharacterized protein [Rutidosis leptorrhynchoides]|uniref:uncharacterized protein n=1 Tax=Rutidosis leptorrhynchoides TaxID=125765 RepID=UPI003A996178
MANNHGGSGSKFVPVNLNKSYGQPSHNNNYPPHSGTYGPGVGTNRARLSGHASGGSGMVVLSRNRPLQKPVPKLSVPPPLNLPSLRREYEKIDSSGAGGGVAGGAGLGCGSRPSSSGMGWTKPGNVALQEKEVSSDNQVDNLKYNEGSLSKGSGTYMPPSARFGGGHGHGDMMSSHHSNASHLERAVVLRGEDFPSLRAALPVSTGPAQKQKEESFQKQKQLVSEESSNDLRNNTRFSSSVHIQSSSRVANGVNENSGQVPLSSSERVDHTRKQDEFLPHVWLNPRSDWADDERDTSHAFVNKSGRDQELPKSETYWDRDFDMPRSSILPHKPPNTQSESYQHISSVVKGPTSEALKTDPYRREINFHSREDRDNNTWRNSSNYKDRSTAPQVTSNQHVTARDSHNDHYGVTMQGRQGGHRLWNNSVDSPRYRNEGYQKPAGSKSTFPSIGKGLSTSDPLLNFGREKSSFANDDHYNKDFSSSVYDERDPFTGNLVGVVKRRKEVTKQTDFHDPVRESFEAELERVQKMQEMERQRIVEEQKRALEQTRREDEERWRVVIEEEERQRRMEEEAREAAWRAEQEKMEAIHKAEELKNDREEEKKRMLLEEERRKQGAKQKLLELEAKIAKRQAEVGKTGNIVHTGADDEVPIGGKDNDVFVDSDDNWEISQRMVDRITTSANSDSSAIDRPFDWPQFSREASSSFVDRGKSPVNPWKRDAFEAGNYSSFLPNDQNGHQGGRSFPRKDIYGGGYMSSRSPYRGGIQDSDIDQRWNSFGDAEPYGQNRDIESEYYNVGNTRSPYSDKLYMNSYGRSRYSMRQPRVLPPPSITSAPKSSVRGDNELSDPSGSLESTARTGNYGGPQDNNEMLRCDSQSSLSVSSPPSSPTHLTNDELDDSAGCSVITTAAEGKEPLEQDLVNDEPAMAASKYVSADEDEEWSVGNHNEMQEQEEYDEDDGYGVEDEVHEGPDDNINLTQEFEHMHLEEKNSSNGLENMVLGFNEGVEVKIPADEFERDSKTDGYTIDKPEVVEKQAEVDEVNHEQPQNAHISSSSTVEMPSTGQSPTPVPSSFPNQTDAPVKLQFGLFSGLSLIPSPVPSIQIGSIQMPLHLHSSVSSSMAHMHPSQPPPPLFQFGQVRYTSPVSHGILPLNSQPTSFVQPNIHHPHFSLHQNSASSLPNQFVQENAAIYSNNQSGNVSKAPSQTHENSQSNMTNATDNRITMTQVPQTEEKGHATSSSQGPGEKNVPMSKDPGPSSVNRGRNVYPARKPGPRTFQPFNPSGSNEFHRKHRRPIQRTEFRVRENADSRLNLGMGSFYNSGSDDKFNNKGMGSLTRSGYRRHMGSNTSLKRVVPETSENRLGKEVERPTETKTQAISSSFVEGNLKRNIPEEDVDAPLQTGVVRVFKQPGIECPSDEDDFIEVRSKRQMLNDRREQREKEIKAKSRVTKQPRKAQRYSFQSKGTSTGGNKIPVSLVGEGSNIRSEFVGSEGRGLVNKEPLAPIGTPTVIDVQTGIRSHTNKRTLQRGSASAVSGANEDDGSNLIFENESKAIDNVQTSLGNWGNARMDQQVIPLTQTQLDEAMKPARFDTTHVTSIGDHTSLVSDSILPSSSTLTKGISIASSSSPINSLLAGEKIQFGAVTSPTVLPPSSHVVSHVIGSQGSFHPDITHNSNTENECNVFFEKDEQITEHREAEVEVAVAAIDTDEIVGNGMGPASSPGPNKVGGDVGGIQGGLVGDQQSGSQSKPEESLSVSLPADLSVETLPISLWPPLPSPQGSSNPMLSHFHGAHPSHFPFYEMNHHHPMMSGPVFAYGPHDESRGTQSQPQKPTDSSSRHIGPPWQNHSGMDSFYGPPTGYTGPFIGSPGGIPGVQPPPPPHMVVYNHYAPVGQFGQVGLSFMGSTYIPSGKQPDWKHDPTSSSRGEEEMKSLNISSGPRNPPNMQPPIQHLAPGSPLLPVGPMLTMFDVPPFQTAPEMSVQPRWSHMPSSPLHVVPMSLPLEQQAEEMTGPSQFNNHAVDQSTYPPNRFSEPQASTPSNTNGLVFPVVRDSTITHFPDELSGPSIATSSGPVAISHISSGTTPTGDAGQVGVGGDNNVKFKNQHNRHGKNLSSHQYNNNVPGGYGYNNQRGGGGVSPKNKSTGQWSTQRRTGFHGRYQSSGADKSFPPSTKVKQIYVAKQPASESSTQNT